MNSSLSFRKLKTFLLNASAQRVASNPTSRSDLIHAGRRSADFDLGKGNDFFSGQTGDDSVQGGNGADTLRGGYGDDVLSGGAGDDRLEAGSGRDRLTGGTGADFFILSSGKNIITDFNPAEGDQLTIQSRDKVKIRTRKNDLILSWQSGKAILENVEIPEVSAYLDQIKLTDQGGNYPVKYDILNDSKYDNNGNYDVRMSGGNDTFIGGYGDDHVFAGSGGSTEDSLVGGGGDDTLLGEEGSDSISGGEGNDYLNVDAYTDDNNGNDTLDGGAGNDLLSLLVTKGGYENIRKAATGNPLFYLSEGHDVVDGFTERATFEFPEGWDIENFETEILKPAEFKELFNSKYTMYPFGDGKRTHPDTITFETQLWSFDYNGAKHSTLIIPLDGEAADKVSEKIPFPQNYKDKDDNFVVDDKKPLKEDSFEFGPGKDQLINTCSLEITGDGVIDLGPNRDIMETNMLISASRLDGGADFDQLILTDIDECADGETADDELSAQSMAIENFERIEVKGGIWQLEGDHSDADVLISGGTTQVPLLSRSLAGLNAKRFQHQDGAIAVDLSDTDTSSNGLDGSWVVLQANGLANSLATTSLDDVFNVIGADNYGAEFRLQGSRLILELSSSSVG